MSKPGGARFGDRGARAIDAVQPRQPAQLVVAERLDAEAQTIDAGAPERREPGLGDRLGIGFERDLAVGGDTSKAASQASMMRAISSGSSSDGVPPPK